MGTIFHRVMEILYRPLLKVALRKTHFDFKHIDKVLDEAWAESDLPTEYKDSYKGRGYLWRDMVKSCIYNTIKVDKEAVSERKIDSVFAFRIQSES